MSNPLGKEPSCCNNAVQNNGNDQGQAEVPPPPRAHTCDDKPVLMNPPRSPPLPPIFPGAKDPAKSKKCRAMMEVFSKPPWVAPIREPPKYLKTFNLNKDDGISPLSQPCNCSCAPLPSTYEPPAISCPDYGPPVRQESAPGLNSNSCSQSTQQPPSEFPAVDQYADKALETAQMAMRPPKCRPVLDTPKTRQFAQSVLDEAQRRLEEQQKWMSDSDLRRSGAGMGAETGESDSEGGGGYDGYNMPGCKSTKHFYSSPQDLRSRIQSYIDSKDKKPAVPNPSLTPFSGFRNDKLNEMICGPAKILEMMADSCCENEEQFLQALGLKDPPPAGGNCTCTSDSPSNTNEAADKSLNDEVNTYMSIMPPNLSCQQQLDYMECMGASPGALSKFQEIQAQAGAGGCAAAEGAPGAPGGPGAPCSSSGPGAPCSSGGPGAPCSSGPDPSQAPGGEPLPKPCSGILKTMNGSSTGKPSNSNSETRRMSMEQQQEKGCYQDYLEQLIAESREVCEQKELEKQRCPCDKIVTVEEEIDEAVLRQHPCFGPKPKPKERSLAETFSMYKDHLSNIRRRYFGAVCKNIDDMEDMTPEVAAAMVLTEEQGMAMSIAPARMYEYLYPETPSQPVVKIGDVSEYSPPGIANLCVPLVPPLMLEAHNFPGLEDPAMLDSPRVIQIGPSMNLADEPKITETKKPGDIVEVITGVTDSYFGMNDVEEEFPIEGEEEEDEGVFEIKLDKALPPHYCRMQLRGSEPPVWFPGYYVAMPSREGVKVQTHLGTVLEQAWEETQPESVRPAGGGIIVGE